jgi:hypothetical protein
MKKRGEKKEINTRNNLDATFIQTLGETTKKAINKTYDNVESVPLNTKRPDTFHEHELNAFSALSAKMFRNAKGL